MNELKQIRLSLGLSQIAAANILNISRRSYQKYENMENVDSKCEYYIYKLKKERFIDENHGILKLDTIKETVNEIFKNYKIESCYLFGSYAKGKAKDDSDIDLLIDSDITGLDFYGLVEELREKLHKKIDLLTLKSISNNPVMLTEILKYGIKIYLNIREYSNPL